MSWTNRVLWCEGLFLQPHHLQQHDRYIEHLASAQRGLGTPYPWGLRRLAIDRELLALGKVALTDCAGILPDGTPFDAPASDPLPRPLDLDEGVAKQTVYLTLPLHRPGAPESGGPDAPETMLRYRAGEITVRDNTLGPQTETQLEVGRLDLRLLLERDARAGFGCCGVARVLDCRPDRQILLDDAYIPPCTDFQASRRLADFAAELSGLLHLQGESRANLVRGAGRGGVSDWANFLLLQLINRTEPVAIHLTQITGLHPEALYRFLLALAGEIAAFASDTKRPPEFAPYRHEDLAATFTPLIEYLRRFPLPVERAIAIPIQEHKFNFHVALVADRSLLAKARFVLAAHANLDPETIRSRLPAQAKVGPIEKIQELVKLALPGIGLHPAPTAPLEIPYHAGFNYFELDRSSEFWAQLAVRGGFGIHIGGDFPGLKLELWAIRE